MWFVVFAVVPYRSDGMDNVVGGEIVAPGDLGVACGTAVEGKAFGQEFGAGGPVERSVNTATSEQLGIGGVDDRVNCELGDVALLEFNPSIHGIKIALLPVEDLTM